jgi:hypothetical protein
MRKHALRVARFIFVATGILAAWTMLRAMPIGARTFEAALELAMPEGGRYSAEVVCVAEVRNGRDQDPSPRVIEVLRQNRRFKFVPRSQCIIEPLIATSRDRSLVVEPATGKRGLLIRVGRDERAFFHPLLMHVSYYEGGLSAAWWNCWAIPVWGGVTLSNCDLQAIS